MIEKMNEYIRVVNDAVIEMLPSADEGQNDVVRAMRYSLANGGKRLRPIFTLEFCKMCGGDVEKALPLACAVEYIHTYSLIHDDLPCMDDDDMRRGNPSCHKMYGEATALLAGDALLTHAFDLVTSADIDGEAAAQAVSLLAQNAGVGGMIGGQVLDLKYETGTPSLTDVLTVYKLKTGALIAAACIMGCIAAGASSEQIEAASKYAYYLGIAFQIKDDLLDIYGDEAKLGKPIGSDENNDKSTYVTLTSAKKAEEDVANLTASAIGELAKFNDNEFLTELSRYLINREK
ncbi:MAG: polyprenyl synthetase family protein [Eubacterium sp.]|nr:polyprenyl synthetase family protein [Eubacterium sp.]MBQ8980285.1 polyprenyl synthetase family protein [Eubacterium sp.]MBR1532105.1 polyprenyl synthetase family protein [Eubacterium sp.]MBR2278838.1 polyprenyl synthetase family protein [Eubacterium sp.]